MTTPKVKQCGSYYAVPLRTAIWAVKKARRGEGLLETIAAVLNLWLYGISLSQVEAATARHSGPSSS